MNNLRCLVTRNFEKKELVLKYIQRCIIHNRKHIDEYKLLWIERERKKEKKSCYTRFYMFIKLFNHQKKLIALLVS